MLKLSNFLQVLLSILVFIFIFFIIVKFTVAFKYLYYYDIKALSITSNFNNTIESYSGKKIVLNDKQVKEDYSYMISYINGNTKKKTFDLPNLPSSEHGKIHFMDVEKIIKKINMVAFSISLPMLIGIILCFIKRKKLYLKITSILLFVTPVIIGVLSLNGFSDIFIKFHKLFFNNNYWLFDPAYDPIILLLPEEFFFHCFILILLLCFICGGILMKLYRSKKLN
ncbi:integral membrane protein (TIGR01906 family) [Clostridium acetobutylicum]|uniref:Uncharacterized membrane protein, homolog of Aquifex (GI:2984271) n=1 Tax=Clostridium acetobutylicum (strain ATCC 824 / DSM 792 / JCM 1419 / IAM 19013 / LMG 5710 / NBRC 13948 / NRRL B-527 / VKM B-1787 / 2291 / W) TaxID=272562 RepID=Q97FM6_CLOAB|nr:MULTISPECIES: TIGR01906 family membrane protein [Clostridium]AAK80651.1 Uncharacterized membrane protein, homolog of Aquifex (GI:2984271) [Clostridium acetobutylicum ATCC 824]ADZ21750.1 Conserved hypothetical protein [Clostridium acetobutylicum EA 2018]AEI32508.1 hypothetical protein SMB_G2740 [Clostridium acetobutylicum DSM 1731]AWV78933.1 TIGR01906 family membrane protein [Clostridium acetobutylicum]MBC2395172.1 TIGR01906 family membrane protein [Clostridium acetobutylicum]